MNNRLSFHSFFKRRSPTIGLSASSHSQLKGLKRSGQLDFCHLTLLWVKPSETRVKRQNVCFSRRVDLSDKMCAFRGLEWAGPGVLCWGYERPAQPCRMAQEGLKSVSMPVS